MTDDTVTPVDMNDLDAFSTSYFDPKVTTVGVPAEEHKEPEASETEEDTLATETDKEASEQEETTEDDDKGKETKPGKKSAQERINEVVAKQKNAERERDALAARLRELEAAATPKPEVNKTEPTPLREQLAPDAPTPDAVKEDGTPKYKLGEYDPEYIRDLTKWTINEENKVLKEAQAAEFARRQMEEAQTELQNNWLGKLEAAEETLPDIREKIGEMETAFANIDPGYGEFLAATIMSCENGPELMYYLSQNIGEAQKIVASGPAAATLALGRLDAKFTKTQTEETSNKRPSAAPTPPPTPNRGAGGRFTVAGDTNDLAAFEKEFYVKK